MNNIYEWIIKKANICLKLINNFVCRYSRKKNSWNMKHFAIVIVLISVNYGEYLCNVNMRIFGMLWSPFYTFALQPRRCLPTHFSSVQAQIISNMFRAVYHSELATEIFHARQTFLSPSSAFSLSSTLAWTLREQNAFLIYFVHINLSKMFFLPFIIIKFRIKLIRLCALQ